MPRKRKLKLTPEVLKQIEGQAAIGLPIEDMATIAGISRSVFSEMVKTDATLRKALDDGRSRSKVHRYKRFYEAAFGRDREYERDRQGNIVKDSDGYPIVVREAIPIDPRCAIFYLETQDRWKRAEKLELTGPNGGPVQVQDVPMTEEQLEAEIARLKLINDDD